MNAKYVEQHHLPEKILDFELKASTINCKIIFYFFPLEAIKTLN